METAWGKSGCCRIKEHKFPNYLLVYAEKYWSLIVYENKRKKKQKRRGTARLEIDFFLSKTAFAES